MVKRVKQIISVSVLSLFLSIVVNAEQLSQTRKQNEHSKPEVPRITAYEAKKLFDEGKVILAMAHERKHYDSKHLIGSISLPNTPALKNVDLPKNQIIAFYCE
jgi:uncharacterized protein (DUF2252 family)